MLMRFDAGAGTVGACLAWLLIGLSGCGGPEGPATFPVQGKIVFERGGTVEELSERTAIIEFESLDEPGVRAYGEVLSDGSFTLSSVKDGAPVGSGAVAGAHRGRFNLDEEVQHLVAPPFLDFEKSGIRITVPSTEEVLIKVWK
jgi:hypothetical protein